MDIETKMHLLNIITARQLGIITPEDATERISNLMKTAPYAAILPKP